jgi:preprotein translocase subunit SecY
MVSAAERLATNFNFDVLSRASELKSRILFLLGALIVYRIGTYIPLPGVDPKVLADVFNQKAGGILDMFNLFAGGALERMTIFALNIMPYISASIIVQLLTGISKNFEALKKEGESGRRKLNQYTRYGTVFLALIQGFGIASWLEGLNSNGTYAVIEKGMLFRISVVATLVGGTLFLMWLGEQINSRGIGNGISLIIFAGIVAGLPGGLAQTFELGRKGVLSVPVILGLLALAIGLVFLIVRLERAQRKIVVQYPKRQVGNKLYQGQSTHMPLKINMAGVIPPIFASAILLFPLTLASFAGPEAASGWVGWVTANLGHGKPLFIFLYVATIIFFSFFYTAIVFNPAEVSENLRKNGGFIPGIRPGQNTTDHLDYIVTRLTVIGAVYIAGVCALPEVLLSYYAVPFYIGGTSLLIVVNVILDTVGQVQSHLFAHQYEGLIKKAKLKGGKL